MVFENAPATEDASEKKTTAPEMRSDHATQRTYAIHFAVFMLCVRVRVLSRPNYVYEQADYEEE